MEVFRALGLLIEAPTPRHGRVADALGLPPAPDAALHGAVVARQRWPYASVHLGAEGMIGGEARDRIAGFRRALGLDGDDGAPGRPRPAAAPGPSAPSPPAADRARREPDHLAALLGLLAALADWRRREDDPARRKLLAQARAALYWEHLASWLGPYLASFEGCGSRFHEAWAALLGGALDEVAAAAETPAQLPAALRAAPAVADPRREGGAAFAASLLAPVRAGVIVLRDDLVRLADEAGLACRAGERRYVLESFFAQDAAAALEWLAGHARRRGEAVAGRGPEPIARWWAGRAGETAALLEELAAEAR